MTMAVASWLLKDPEHTHKMPEDFMLTIREFENRSFYESRIALVD